VGNKASLANYISEYTSDHTANYIPHGKSIVLIRGFTEGKIVKAVSHSGVSAL